MCQKMLRKHWRIFIAAAFVALASYWLLWEEEPAGRRAQDRDGGAQNIVMTGGEIIENQDGEKVWELKAESIEIDEKTSQNILAGVKGKLYRKAGGTIDIAAGGGTYSPGIAQIQLSGGVVAVYSEGWTLKCQEISWASAENLIVAKGGAEFAKGDLWVQGDEIITDRELMKIKVAGGSVRKGKKPSGQS
jgi:hypothetical protein